MTIKPLGDRLLVEIKNSEEKTIGGIIIPQNIQKNTQEGIVVSLGELNAVYFKKGDSIIFNKDTGTQIKIDNKDYLILEIENILAVIE